jgi:hypothetical protein
MWTTGKVLIFGLMGLILAGCESRQMIWQRLTQNTTVTFFAPVSCGAAPNQSLTVIGSYSLVRNFQWGGGLQQGMYDPRMKERFPGNYFAYTLTIIDASGRDQRLSAFLLGTSDASGIGFPLTYTGRGPGSFSFVTVAPPFNQGEQSVPASTDVAMCGYLHRIPWSSSLNLPYWISGELINPDAPDDYRLGIDLALIGLTGFVLLALFCLLCLPFGFVIIDSERERAATRFRSCSIFLASCAIVFAILFGLRNGMQTSLDELTIGQGYYDFYQSLPKSNGLLQPVSYFDAQRLFAGPPTPDQMEQSPEKFWLALGAALVAGAFAFGAHIYKGWYWLFVPLPLQVRFQRATRRGEWPRAEELIEAIREGAMNKTAWQSKMMELKAMRFEAKLNSIREGLIQRMQA